MDPDDSKGDDLDPSRGIVNALMILVLITCVSYLAVMIFSA
jgi:hypothetical protein